MIQVNEMYKTISGLKAHVIAKVSNTNYPIAVALTIREEQNIPYQIVKQYTTNGKLRVDQNNWDDLDLTKKCRGIA